MIDSLNYIALTLITSLSQNSNNIFLFLPGFLLIELPLVILVISGVFRWGWHQDENQIVKYPSVSFIITCYGEGDAITQTVDTLVEQIYPGKIEILAIVDGAKQNNETYQAALRCAAKYKSIPFRKVRVIPKWQRGGRVSTLNSGLFFAKHDIVINVDGDTSFDNDMTINMVKHFQSSNTLAVGGALKVRNWQDNILTRMQAIEYMLSMQLGKTGMANWGVLNNISGAFGGFRRKILNHIGGWDTHTAEDLDLTVRLKQYKRRYPKTKLAFSPHAVGHTDVPSTIKGLIQQRLRWDGDLLFLYLRKHNKGLTPKLLGWGNFVFILVYGIFQNVILPLLVIIYLIYICMYAPWQIVLTINIILYLMYLVITSVYFILYINLISERPMKDIKFVVWLWLYPIYQFLMRIITAFSMFNELIRRSHEESNMAPWWVLKKGKRF
ncbi:glycosyltransferase family 2 protein [Photobacterium damselae]|uniref:N-acetylglucosaminyltransferase n=2 Tax=Photobacterium damselae TaxID=38293 RepID=D0YX91_PHODD|nr:glycosyltransferase [Photobacterium damselae]EEZ40918.1 hypothetical protein VDA_001950 [Photobacterium damselae subsp. damselae CIP 102761]SPY28418.1 Poly-beta-1,6-N-acetyl-D-glucosamine synthase [Photobacterium damselae]